MEGGYPLPMARPIEPTPPLFGADADRLIAELEHVAPTAEIVALKEAACAFLAEVSRPKGPFRLDPAMIRPGRATDLIDFGAPPEDGVESLE